MGAEPAVGRQAVLDRGRELVLGRQPVVDGHDERAGALGQPRAQAVMRLEVALHPAAAVKVRHGRQQRPRGGRGVDARRNLARRARNADVLDAGQRRRRLVHQRHHRAQLLAQLGQRRKVARHADGFDELPHDLGLGIHRAAPPADPVTVEQAQRVLLAQRGVRQLQHRGRLLVAHARPPPCRVIQRYCRRRAQAISTRAKSKRATPARPRPSPRAKRPRLGYHRRDQRRSP